MTRAIPVRTVRPRSAKPKLLLKETYLALIRGSVGSMMFRQCFALLNRRTVDILRRGELSCAFYMTSVLRIAGLIRRVHVTVEGALKDLRQSGWRCQWAQPLRPGAIIVWAAERFADGEHRHLGFSLGGNKAVSTSSASGRVAAHDATFNGRRAIELVYWHPRLGRSSRSR